MRNLGKNYLPRIAREEFGKISGEPKYQFHSFYYNNELGKMGMMKRKLRDAGLDVEVREVIRNGFVIGKKLMVR